MLARTSQRRHSAVQILRRACEPCEVHIYRLQKRLADFITIPYPYREDDVRQAVLIAATKIVRRQLAAALNILGIRVPNQM